MTTVRWAVRWAAHEIHAALASARMEIRQLRYAPLRFRMWRDRRGQSS